MASQISNGISNNNMDSSIISIANDKITVIQKNIEKMELRMNLVINKIAEIKKVCLDIQTKKTLYTTDDPILELQFQINLLTNDKSYLSNLRKIFVNKLNEDFFNLANSIILLLSSITNLDFKDPDTEESILKRIKVIKKPTDMLNLNNITDILSTITNNLLLIRDFLDQFDAYINAMKSKVVNEVFHCAGLHPELAFKRQCIFIEFQKHQRVLDSLLGYYHDLSQSIISQCNNMKISDYCGTNRITSPDSPGIDSVIQELDTKLNPSAVTTLNGATVL